MARKYLDTTGLTALWAKIKGLFNSLATVASTGEYSDLLHPPTVAEIDDNSTANNKAWSASKINTRLNDPVTFVTDDIPEKAENLGNTATAHRITAYQNGLSIPYRGNNTNDGGILRVRGKSESDCILELGTWDDSGSGETIQFNYYPTNSQITPTYSVTVPKKSGTIALTSDLPDISEKVNKAGDTMTGALTMSNVNVNVTDTDVKVGTAPSSTIFGNGFYCQSTNGGDLFYVRATQDTSDNVGMQIEVRRVIGSTTYYNTLRLGISNTGDKTVNVSDPADWRSALGLGTMATQNTGSWQPAWANNTLYPIGDDVKIGDQNVGGTLVVQGANADGDVQIRRQNGSVITSLRSVYNKQLTSSVSFTRSHASVSYQEGLVCNRCGNVVTFAGYFSCGATIGANTTLYSGLPKPAGGKSIYFTWSGYDFYLHPTDGSIRTNGQIVSRTYVGTFTYVCA